MPLELNHGDAGFEAAFTGLLAAKRETQEDV
jgi:histidinol dehydrogenase